MPVVTKRVPFSALRFAAGVEIGSNGEGAKTAPVKIMARSPDPVDHWWWGRIVHDMSGMSVSKERLTLDYCHNDSEVLGYANQFDTSSGSLVVSGALTPFEEKDRASEVLFKAGQGVPYEASIFFDQDSIVLESVPQGMTVQVNGKPFEGPGVVARQWSLLGVAICPHGQDANTSVQFKANPGPEVSVKYNEEEKPAETTETVVVEADPVIPVETETVVETEQKEGETETTPAAPVDPANALSQGPKFLSAFGDKGGVWFAQGKTFEEAQSLFNQELQIENKSLREKNTELVGKLSASRGERSPVSFQEGEPEKVITQKHAHALPAGLAKFASSIKLPK